jgi:hypothetical protein
MNELKLREGPETGRTVISYRPKKGKQAKMKHILGLLI